MSIYSIKSCPDLDNVMAVGITGATSDLLML